MELILTYVDAWHNIERYRYADGVPWEQYTLLADVEAETAADLQLRSFLGQQTGAAVAAPGAAGCCAPASCMPQELVDIENSR
jgi:hypothetical protein